MRKKGLFGILVVLIVVSIFAMLPYGLERPGVLRIGTGGSDGHYYKLASLLKSDSPQHIQVLETAGSLENLTLLKEGQIEFALIQSGIAVDDDVLAIASIAEQYVHLLVETGSPIKSLRQARDENALVGIGNPGSGTLDLGKRIFEYFPMRTSAVRLSHHSHLEDDQKPQVFFSVYSLHAPLMEKLLSDGSFDLLPISMNLSMAQHVPGCYPAEMPPYLYGKGRTIPAQPIPTLKVKTLLVTRASTDAAKVRHLLNVIYASKHSEFVEITEAEGSRGYGVQLHPAAISYYHRNDPISADKFEIGGVLLAVLIFIASAFQYGTEKVNARKLTRKRLRIRPYFKQLLELNRAIAGASAQELEGILEKISIIQGEAEAEWLDDRLDTEHMENLYVVCSARIHQVEVAQSQLRKQADVDDNS